MKRTKNLKMNLPDGTDAIDVSVLNGNFTAIDSELEPIMVADTLAIKSAYGKYSFYHGTIMPFNSLLGDVETTWGKAVFREKYGEFSPAENSIVELNVVIEVVDGIIYWDEYYNNPTKGVYIGESTFKQTGTGDTYCEFNYINDDAGESKQLSLREAVLEILSRITVKE